MRSATSMVLGALLMLSACEKVDGPGAPPDTMQLIRSGSLQACAAADVEQTLRDMILPPAANVLASAPQDIKAGVLGGFRVTFDATTFEGHDPAIARVACNTVVHITGPEGGSERFPINFSISPSAQDPQSFVVSASSDAISQRLSQLYLVEFFKRAAQQAAMHKAAAEEAALQAVRAVIAPEWLRGRWIAADAPGGSCVDGPWEEYRSNGAYASHEASGTWIIDDTRIIIDAATASDPAPFRHVENIVEANVSGYTAVSDSGTRRYRRCMIDDMASPQNDGVEPRAPQEPAAEI